jgi:hypothetical protein
MDNDGDLDIVTQPFNGSLVLYKNNMDVGEAVSIVLEDGMGNYNGIGAKVIIRYGENNKLAQIREIKAGGGYLSIEHAVAWFGLADYEVINEIEIQWPDGETSFIRQPLDTGHQYKVVRHSPANALLN